MRAVLILTAFFFSLTVQAQSADPESLQILLENATNDSVRFSIYTKLSDYYNNKERKTAHEYNEAALKIARKNNMNLEIANSLGRIGYYLNKEDRYGEAFECYIEGIQLAEDPDNEHLSWTKPADADPFQYRMAILAWLHHDLGLVFRSTNNNMEAIQQFRKSSRYLDKALPTSHNSVDMNIGAVYLDMNILDSALYYQRKELVHADRWKSAALNYIGDIHFRNGDSDSAFIYYHKGLSLATDQNAFSLKIICEMSLGKWHMAAENKDSSLIYARRFLKGIKDLQGNPLKDINISNAYELLYQAYQLNQKPDSMMKYLQLAYVSRDSVSQIKIANLTQYQNISFDEQLRLEVLEKEKLQTKNRIRIYSLLTGLVFILIVAFILYRNVRQKHKANTILKKTLSDLKSTQSQLIQSEKMASLGELTAGIAHEIQNPLNFVNNFSEVSSELLDELNDELDQGELEEVKSISKDIKQNLEKITHHGKRADAIVKGMLQHSRTNTGQKEPTDINALADEYLRLSYHGLRAKDKNFNADFKTDFDPNIPKIEVVPQDIGRVMLNLITNAFYAVNERVKKDLEDIAEKGNESLEGRKPIKPLVTVTTKNLGDQIEISVKDNGSGIPEEIKNKIFQPFFTTKPTGEGTGLGLSMSYDIITKGHGGKLIVESIQNEESIFVIRLPII
jgi:two-component system NtrC family sensor kinase